jgi:serine/threonine protein phosphatase 1
MRLVVGDIHACYLELLDLLDQASIGPDDEILAVGDLVDRGPANREVLDFFQQRPGASSIVGNHERKHLRWARGELAPAPSQRIAHAQLGEAYPKALAFLATFPRHCELPEALVVHGFWEPGVPLERQRDTVLIGTLSGEQHLTKRYAQPWYELYDGSKPLIVGHRDYRRDGQPLVYQDRVFAIDTGCCHGGRLTGLLLPAFRFVSVPARANHWEQTQRDFGHLVGAGGGLPDTD